MGQLKKETVREKNKTVVKKKGANQLFEHNFSACLLFWDTFLILRLNFENTGNFSPSSTIFSGKFFSTVFTGKGIGRIRVSYFTSIPLECCTTIAWW